MNNGDSLVVYQSTRFHLFSNPSPYRALPPKPELIQKKRRSQHIFLIFISLVASQRDITLKWKQGTLQPIMEWNNPQVGSHLRPFVAARPENPLAYLYSYNNFDHLHQHPPPAGLEVKHGVIGLEDPLAWLQSMEKNNHKLSNSNSETNDHNYCSNNMQDKKKRLTCDQLESLEKSFLEEIKLDPDRKIRLARDLGLQPRQIAVWFQNRRARWKNKQLERLYDALKQEYEVVAREKQKLQDEVVKLQAMLREHGVRNQVSATGYTVSGEDTIESAAIVANSRPQPAAPLLTGPHQIEETNYPQAADQGYTRLPVQSGYWQQGGGGIHQLPPYP